MAKTVDIGFALNYQYANLLNITPEEDEPTWAYMGPGIEDISPDRSEKTDETEDYSTGGNTVTTVTGVTKTTSVTGKRRIGDPLQDYLASLEECFGDERETQYRCVSPTGEIIEDIDAVYESQSPRRYASRPVDYEDREFTVCALVLVRQTVNYRYYGADQYVLNSEVFKDFTGTDSIMHWCFNTTDEAEPEMEAFLADYTENVQSLYDYESRAAYVEDFEGFRNMFYIVGGALSFVVGLVGVLNFVNAVLTGILTRKRELAVLQSVGMTGKQLKTML